MNNSLNNRLNGLPTEIFTNVAMNLNAQDLLAVRLTDKPLRCMVGSCEEKLVRRRTEECFPLVASLAGENILTVVQQHAKKDSIATSDRFGRLPRRSPIVNILDRLLCFYRPTTDLFWTFELQTLNITDVRFQKLRIKLAKAIISRPLFRLHVYALITRVLQLEVMATAALRLHGVHGLGMRASAWNPFWQEQLSSQQALNEPGLDFGLAQSPFLRGNTCRVERLAASMDHQAWGAIEDLAGIWGSATEGQTAEVTNGDVSRALEAVELPLFKRQTRINSAYNRKSSRPPLRRKVVPGPLRRSKGWTQNACMNRSLYQTSSIDQY